MKKTALFIILATILFASCTDRKEQEQKTTTELSDKPIVVSNGWIRPGIINRNTGAFMNITNSTNIDDTLFSVSSNLADVVELHETFTRENDLKGMRHIDYLVIPKNTVVELKPGSFHVMLIGLKIDLSRGFGAKLKLNFKNNGNFEIDAVVK